MTDYNMVLESQRKYFRSGETKDVTFRIKQLVRMYQWINMNEEIIMYALKKDLNKSPFEAYATEIGIIKEELRYTIKNLKKWSKTKCVKTPITQFPAKSFIYQEPYGIVLIMSPWNYPFQLTIAPLIGAISGGNCAVLKPSAYSANTSAVICRMIKEVFSPSYVDVIQGGRVENEALLNQKFDYIFFTGSGDVGKIVLEKAAKNLTPVSLELGGKSPCIVDETADIKLAAKRIIWGKLLNAGQTCVCPDYILVHRDVKEKLIKQMERMICKMYGKDPINSPDYPKMINEKHFLRVKGLLEGESIVTGGNVNESTLQIAPTILDNITWNSPIMQEEIFGPILPILVFDALSDVVQWVNTKPKPLALYFFTKNKERENYVLSNISYGGGCINDTIVHLGTSHLPFGGIGASGMGAYHGKASFDTFSHGKSIMKKSLLIDIPLRYAPFKNHLEWLKRIQK